MEFVYQNINCAAPEVSIILLDWNCRESFHALDYLNQQSVPRENFEIIWIEYYSRQQSEIREKLSDSIANKKPPVVDQWIVMTTPNDTYYHKHLMYNIGITVSNGRIICIADSDGIFKPSFVSSIITAFDEKKDIVLHMDEVRNTKKRFYPFNYPTFEEILGPGCINWKDGKTTGLRDIKDPLHTRNYGACMCALRKDIIAIGGADEHIDFLGHVCGPYDLTFRLVNAGKEEVWHDEEYLYHVWHHGTDGIDNYIGPHDGRHMSSTALEAISSKRIFPLVENKAIEILRKNGKQNSETLKNLMLKPDYQDIWSFKNIKASKDFYKMEDYSSWSKHMSGTNEVIQPRISFRTRIKKTLRKIFGTP